MIWIIYNQKGRRNIADIDRIALESKRESIVARKAKANLSAGGGDKKSAAAKSGSAKLPKAISPINTRQQSAKSAGVGQRTYDAGKMVLDAAAKGEIDKAAKKVVASAERLSKCGNVRMF